MELSYLHDISMFPGTIQVLYLYTRYTLYVTIIINKVFLSFLKKEKIKELRNNMKTNISTTIIEFFFPCFFSGIN